MPANQCLVLNLEAPPWKRCSVSRIPGGLLAPLGEDSDRSGTTGTGVRGLDRSATRHSRWSAANGKAEGTLSGL